MKSISKPLRVLLWSCVFIYIVICSLQITQVDIWWQLSEGSYILRTFHLPTQPIAAFGLPARPYFDEYAGYEVVLTLIYKATGFPGLWMLFGAIYLTIMFLPSFYSRRNNSSFDFFSCFALLLAGILMKNRLEQRPELVGSLLQVLLMMMLRSWKLEAITPRSVAPLFFLFVAWSNTHSSFIVGIFTLFLWIGCELVLKCEQFSIASLMRHGLMLGAVALIAVLINPYGAERFLFPFRQALDPAATALSSEMGPIMDPLSVFGFIVLLSAGLIAWAVLRSKTTSLWLVLFAVFSVYMAFKSFRCINLLAIAVLFVYAARDAQLKPDSLRSSLLTRIKTVGLLCFCPFLLVWNAFSFLSAFNEMKSEDYFAQHANPFAPEIVDAEGIRSDQRLPVLCGYAEGSYLSLDRNQSFRPLLDSGLAHFSDETKRYFFFIWNQPKALAIALRSLDVGNVVVNRDTYPWIIELRTSPGWTMTACTERGMLWKRGSGGIYNPSPSDRAEIADSRERLLKSGNATGAFCYSTLIDSPRDSLALLARSGGADWSDSMFNYFAAWLDGVPQTTLQEFLANDGARLNTPLGAILWARLGPEKYDEFIRTVPPGPRPWLWNVVQVRMELERGNRDQARKSFQQISANPSSSLTYYSLRRDLQAADPSGEKADMDAYGQWQTWDESSESFMRSMSVRLNERMADLSGLEAK